MTELEKARYNATKKAKDEKAKIKQALPIGGLLNFLEGGARPRAIVGGLLNGDTTALNGLLGEVKQLADPNYMRNVKGMSEQDAINIALDANPIMAGTMKGNIIDAIAPKTKYELAHELAQKNAVEMLGLHPNNTAMDRAKAMGFDTHAYHGTRGDISAFDLSRHGQSYKRFDNPPPQVYAGVGDIGRDVASAYGTNGSVYPLMIKNHKMVGADMQANIPNYEALIDNVSNIRSRFAAFDPARAHEADILGMATPEMLGLLALGSGAGVAYANSRKDKKGNNK